MKEARESKRLPLFSVLMTAYNREQFIAEAIESVLSSTYPEFELIVVDDCSTDKTVEIATRYVLNEPRIRLFVNEKNLGDYPNRNRAASYASGEYLMFVDSDDLLEKDGIEKCYNVMMRFPSSSFGMRYFGTETEPFQMEPSHVINDHFFKQFLLCIGPGGTIIKRSLFEQCLGYPESYGPANDMFFNLKACCQTPVVFIPFSFLFYRRHTGQEINNKYKYIYNNYLYLKDALRLLPLPLEPKQIKWLEKKNKRRFLINAFRFFFRTGEIGHTRFLFRATSFRLQDFLQAIFH